MNNIWDTIQLPSAVKAKAPTTALKAGGYDNTGILDWANSFTTPGNLGSGTTKSGIDVSSHPFNPLNQNNQFTDPNGATPAPTNLNPVEKFATGIASKLPQTIQSIDELGKDPLSLGGEHSGLFDMTNVKQAVSDMWNAIKAPVMQEGQNIKNAVEVYSDPNATFAQKFGAQTKDVAGAAGILFSPISALFAGANKVPILGTVSKLISLPFQAAGEGAPQISNGIIDKLPISQQAKDQIKPGIGEIFALAAQIALGKAGVDNVAWSKLKAKFGETDATTIVTKAQELAQQKIEATKPTEAPVTPKTAPETAITPKVDSSVSSFKTPENVQQMITNIETQLKENQVNIDKGYLTKEEGQPFIDAKKPQLVELKKTLAEFINPLSQEATKYKSAEEFVNSQTKMLHGTDKKFSVFDPTKMGTNEKNFAAKTSFFFTDSAETAGSYGKNIKEVYAKFDNPVTIDAKGKMFGDMRDVIDEMVTNAKKNGNDGVIIKNLSDRKDWGNYEPATHYAVFDTTKLQTKSQLTDIWNKANKPVDSTVSQVTQQGQTAVMPAEGKTAKASTDINTQVVKKGFDELPQEELAKYDPITKADQIEKVSKLLTKDPQKAIDMATGKTPVTGDINSQVIFNAVKNKALAEGDVSTIRDLANSPIATERSVAAQKLGASGFNNGEADPVKAIRDVMKAREQKGVDLKTEAKKIKTIPHTKETWSSFIESIKC